MLVIAFTVARADPLPETKLDPSFDQVTAVGFASELARRFPDRVPGTAGSAGALAWMRTNLRGLDLEPEEQAFSADVPGVGRKRLVNLVAIAPGRAPDAIVVMAHRDNLGRSPGANDNASGTGVLLELARDVGSARPAHTFVFLSTDGGAYGGLGAAEFAADRDFVRREIGRDASIVAVVNLDALAGGRPARLVFAGESARSPASALLASADASLRAQTRASAERPGAFAQLVDLAFPFSLHEQAPFVAREIPAVTITTGGERPAPPEADTLDALRADQLGAHGRAAQALVRAVDESVEIARGTDASVYLGSRVVRGWTIEFLFLAALLPFLATTVDLFARCRRRHIALAPALRSFASRLGVWIWAGCLFALFAVSGLLADAPSRPIAPESPAAQDWPAGALAALAALSLAGWLVARPRLAARGLVGRADELGGHLSAMLVLAIVALVVAATNPFALLFVLPSLHAWLWLPHVSDRGAASRIALYGLGFVGPLLLLGSFAFRFDLGLDAPWYVTALAAVGYVPAPLLTATVVWGAAAAQVGSLAAGRYTPYPSAEDRPPRGPIRELIRRAVLLSRRRRTPDVVPEAEAEVYSLRE